MRIWAKAMKEDKITKDGTYEVAGRLTKQSFFSAIRAVCEIMDIPCPVVLSSHYSNLATYRTTKFTPIDFVESIPFDTLTIEDITTPD